MAPMTRSRTARVMAPSNASTLDLRLPPDDADSQTIESDGASTDSFDSVPPVYTIDLSLPPEQRYVEVAKDFRLVVEDLTHIFDDLLDSVSLPKKLFHFVARVILRKLYSKEQTDELRGISKVTNVPMYLLVAYNVLLDIFMGCTSGGIRVKERGKRTSKMMHFRTLDWGMPELRNAIVQLEFVTKPGGEVIARTISYVGFVGVLTGVRKGMSLSLNFRPYHNNDGSKWSNLKFYGHLFLVLVGLRPCIAAHLRDFILPRTKRRRRKPSDPPAEKPSAHYVSIGSYPSHTLAHVAGQLPPIPTTAAYLTFCSATQAIVLEKDRVTAHVLLSTSFITATNHDVSYEHLSNGNAQAAHAKHAKQHHFGIGMQELVDESMERKGCMVAKWEKRCRKMRQKKRGGERGDAEGVGMEELKRWLLEYPVTNYETHFVAIMDPSTGMFRWVRCFDTRDFGSEDEEGLGEG